MYRFCGLSIHERRCHSNPEFHASGESATEPNTNSDSYADSNSNPNPQSNSHSYADSNPHARSKSYSEWHHRLQH